MRISGDRIGEIPRRRAKVPFVERNVTRSVRPPRRVVASPCITTVSGNRSVRILQEKECPARESGLRVRLLIDPISTWWRTGIGRKIVQLDFGWVSSDRRKRSPNQLARAELARALTCCAERRDGTAPCQGVGNLEVGDDIKPAPFAPGVSKAPGKQLPGRFITTERQNQNLRGIVVGCRSEQLLPPARSESARGSQCRNQNQRRQRCQCETRRETTNE